MIGKAAILITGAAHGIGRATATALAARGDRVGLLDRDGQALDRLAAGLNARVATAAVDLVDPAPDAVRRAVARVEAGVGPIGTLVACAGVGGLTRVPDLDIDGFRSMLAVNVLGVARSIEAVLPGMIARGGGHIVGVSSVAGHRGLPWMAEYSASKAALTAYLEALRPALKRRGVTITTACPGFVRTALTVNTPFRKPVKMLSPEQAAIQLVKAIDRRPRNHVFPFGTSVGMAVLRHLPDRVFDWMMDRAGPRALTTEF